MIKYSTKADGGRIYICIYKYIYIYNVNFRDRERERERASANCGLSEDKICFKFGRRKGGREGFGQITTNTQNAPEVGS